MHAQTIAALSALAASLDAHPEDRTELLVYGLLPARLLDALEAHLSHPMFGDGPLP